MWSLSGVVVIIIGLALRYNPLLVILMSGFVTGISAGMTPTQIIEAIGASFAKNRYMSLFILLLPMIGVLERHGLKERAEQYISQFTRASIGKILTGYLIFGKLTKALGLQVHGHSIFIRPLISPMLEGSAHLQKKLTPAIAQKIRALAASSENFSNFFGQNLFIAAGGLLLIKGLMEEQGYPVALETMAGYALASAACSLVICIIRFALFDRWLCKQPDADQE